jgi:DNA-binding SARP family transcriptional activator/tetratricopeptide (TPR) repeat protein
VPGAMEFGLLGPVVVRNGGRELAAPRGRVGALLAGLLLQAGQVVSVDALTGVLWPGDPPVSAPMLIRHHVWQLRQALGQAGGNRIVTRPGGYLIQAGDNELDLARFEQLLAGARTATRDEFWERAAAQAEQALELWRGEPLAGVESAVLATREVPRLSELRLQATELRLEARLHLGGHAEAAAELARLAAEHPLREHVHALLMLASYRCGRQADALAAYQQVRTRLVEELGAEPGAELQAVHQQILTADPALDLPQPAADAMASLPIHIPRQLPAAVASFTGRAAELAALTRIVDHQDGGGTPGTVVISAIGGTAGVGKTALAIHFAHQAASRFPDGQLYTNLRGFDPVGRAASPAEAIRGFLDALGVPSQRIPETLDAQLGLYRSLLAGRRMLIVLDNARDEQQVRPLIPASAGTLVIVTSRSQLIGLAAADGAQPVTVDVLSEDEARQMLAARLGSTRTEAEADAVSQIARLCACLPLALGVTAARASTRPGFPLASLAEELRDADSRLDALDAGDPGSCVRAVFSWSCQQLTQDAARMFRLLGLHPGPDISVPAAASLTATDAGQARRLLAELARAHLITEHAPGRFTFHDLLRAYAADQARAADGESGCSEAVGRALDHYLHTAHSAAMLVNQSLDPIITVAPRPGVTPEALTGHQQAVAWLEAEQQVLLAAVALADAAGFDVHAWQIPWTMADFLHRHGRWHQKAAIQATALAAATRLDDKAGQAASLNNLAQACSQLGDHYHALAHCAQSLTLYQQLGDRIGEARVHQRLAVAAESRCCYGDALGYAEQALRLYRAAGHRRGEVLLLNNIGRIHGHLGDYQRARIICQQALALSSGLGLSHVEAHVLDSLGYAEHRLGGLVQATACYQRALSGFREFGNLPAEAGTLARLGDIRQATGELTQARDAWRQALAIFDELRHPDAGQVRARLAAADGCGHLESTAAASR